MKVVNDLCNCSMCLEIPESSENTLEKCTIAQLQTIAKFLRLEDTARRKTDLVSLPFNLQLGLKKYATPNFIPHIFLILQLLVFSAFEYFLVSPIDRTRKFSFYILPNVDFFGVWTICGEFLLTVTLVLYCFPTFVHKEKSSYCKWIPAFASVAVNLCLQFLVQNDGSNWDKKMSLKPILEFTFGIFLRLLGSYTFSFCTMHRCTGQKLFLSHEQSISKGLAILKI